MKQELEIDCWHLLPAEIVLHLVLTKVLRERP
jgi:hypothetical protein